MSAVVCLYPYRSYWCQNRWTKISTNLSVGAGALKFWVYLIVCTSAPKWNQFRRLAELAWKLKGLGSSKTDNELQPENLLACSVSRCKQIATSVWHSTTHVFSNKSRPKVLCPTTRVNKYAVLFTELVQTHQSGHLENRAFRLRRRLVMNCWNLQVIASGTNW